MSLRKILENIEKRQNDNCQYDVLINVINNFKTENQKKAAPDIEKISLDDLTKNGKAKKEWYDFTYPPAINKQF